MRERKIGRVTENQRNKRDKKQEERETFCDADLDAHLSLFFFLSFFCPFFLEMDHSEIAAVSSQHPRGQPLISPHTPLGYNGAGVVSRQRVF